MRLLPLTSIAVLIYRSYGVTFQQVIMGILYCSTSSPGTVGGLVYLVLLRLNIFAVASGLAV